MPPPPARKNEAALRQGCGRESQVTVMTVTLPWAPPWAKSAQARTRWAVSLLSSSPAGVREERWHDLNPEFSGNLRRKLSVEQN